MTREIHFIITLFLSSIFYAQERPNIIFIMSDDHAANAIGVYGGRLSVLNPTPNIDKLASEGIVFKNAFCNNSICTPSRASILTGQYSQTNGVLDLHHYLPKEKQFLAKELKSLGYETAVIGKWHLKEAPESFDYYEVLPLQGKYHNPELVSREGRIKKELSFGRYGKKEVLVDEYKGHSSDVITSRSIEWLKNKRDKSKPFFLMHHFKAPHGMFEFAPRYSNYLEDTYIPEPASLYQKGNHGSVGTRGINDSLIHDIGSSVGMRNSIRGVGRNLKGFKTETNDPEYKHKTYQEYLKRYLRCVKGVDDNIKRLVDYLKAEGLYENTIIVYTSDQGMMLGEHDYIDKRWMYEESLRMPFIVHYPKDFKKGIENSTIINNTDFAPTLIDIAGGSVPSYMQGKSFKSILFSGIEPNNWRTSTYYRYWMHMGSRHANPAHFGIRTKDSKLIFYYGRYYKTKDKIVQDGWGRYDYDTPVSWEFYDLKKDPNEMQNEYNNSKYENLIAKLKRELKTKRKTLNEEDHNYPHIQEIIQKHWND
ncbi:sulfatase family protein [Seonamhaeicola marinus]|uniref:Sulfatase n=1 Tax=Seonamhaeicola marinus TaxID=1912246 RepID=A0A5D0HKC5_9FLAO|nr:sulfatase [Seonamhaeicola marinus]TYA71748.1 sulfatase [Seonamhaeicola marinus]